MLLFNTNEQFVVFTVCCESEILPAHGQGSSSSYIAVNCLLLSVLLAGIESVITETNTAGPLQLLVTDLLSYSPLFTLQYLPRQEAVLVRVDRRI